MAFFRRLKLLHLNLKISWKYRHYFSTCRKTIKLAERTLMSEPVAWRQGNNFLILSICVLAMTLTRMRSIYSLCKNGLAKDAVILLRVLFEDIVNFNFMDNDKKRIQDFMDYDSCQRLKLGKMVSSSKKIKDLDKFEERKTELEEIWSKVKHKYTYIDKKGRKKIFRTWSRKSLEDMAKELNAEETYNYLYRYLSMYVHLTPLTFNDYILGRNKKNVVVEIGLSERFIPEVLSTSSVLVIDMLVRVINEQYSLGLSEEIEELVEEIKNLK